MKLVTMKWADDLLAKLDQAAEAAGESRSEYLRTAAELRMNPPVIGAGLVLASPDVEVILDRYPAPGDIVTEVPPPPPAPPRRPDTERVKPKAKVPRSERAKPPKPVDPGRTDVVTHFKKGKP